MGLYWDNGKENGNYELFQVGGLSPFGVMENQMEKNMGNDMETREYIGITRGYIYIYTHKV